MNTDIFSKIFNRLRGWPVHPQWFIFLNSTEEHRRIARQAGGTVLDIGCYDQYMKPYLAEGVDYIGLDYYQTAQEWYNTRPHVYGDAQHLPVASDCIDTVLLLDVLEHLPHPEEALAEIGRVLKSRGRLVLQVPFLYPLHDEPLDFQRWTRHGLRKLLQDHGFCVCDETVLGRPLETAALLGNIALSKTVLNWLHHKNPLLLLVIVVPAVVLVLNVTAWLLARLGSEEDMLPHGYRFLAQKR